MKKNKGIYLLLTLLLTAYIADAQIVYELWEGKVKPYYKENSLKEFQEERWGTYCLLDVTEPTLTVYEAKGENSGKAVLVIPGGGYEAVAIHHEGYEVAKVLSSRGITAGVLKYRLPNPVTSEHPELVPLADMRRALVLLRELAEKYGFNKEEVGAMGFSAGSHLATVAGLWASEKEEEYPDFSALIYGVTNLSEVNLSWLEESLYFRKLSDNEIRQNTLLDLVSENTPPAFLVHASDDEVCLVEETTLYAQKLYEHDIQAEVHIFSEGGHGFGLGRKEDGTDQWIGLFVNWLKTFNE